MKVKSLFPILLGLVCVSPVTRAADTYTIDAMHSSVGFGVSHMVINTVKGKFNEFSGSVVVDGKQITEAKGTIQTKSIDTGVAPRDKHLRSADFFDAEKYPVITFQTKQIQVKGADPVLVGAFTMHGVTKEISLPVTLKGPIKDPMGTQRIGLQIKTKLDRKDYGLTYNKVLETGGLAVGEEVEIEINAEAVKAGPR
jgi:polyisoprenoid-binding protein YceI